MENNNNKIIGLSNEFLIELAKTKPTNLQNAVNEHYDLWNKEGGLIQMLTQRDMGVYKVLASILVSGGYGHANEMNVGRCVRRLVGGRKALTATVSNPHVVITSAIDTEMTDLVQPGGRGPSSAVTLTHAKHSKAPVSHDMTVSVSKTASTVPDSSVGQSVAWWNEVAQSLGVEIKKVPEGFNWGQVASNLSYQRDRTYENSYTENELLLFSHVLFNARKGNIPMKNVYKATIFILKNQGDIAYDLMTKAMNIGTISLK